MINTSTVSNRTINIESFDLDSGIPSGDIEIDCCLWGDTGKPLVVLLGGISANRWALDCDGIDTKGWWHDVFNTESHFNLNEHCFLTFEYLTFSHRGTKPPVITTSDQARLLRKLQIQLSLPLFHAVIGASYGGMVSFSFAAQFPTALEQLICIAASDRNSVRTQALRHIQREIIKLGLQLRQESGAQKEYVSLARSLAMIGYRGEIEWEQRFQSDQAGGALKSVAEYLQHHGDCFADQFSASRYCQLSQSIDHHQVDVGLIEAETLLIAISTDQMVTVDDIKSLPNKFNANCQSVVIDSIYGHDGFLLEAKQINHIFNTFLSEHTHDYIEPNNRCASGY